MENDSALLERYSKTGDAEAFTELARRYARLVYGTCLRITANPQEAEDITQECFLELSRKAGTVRASLPGWLHKVAKNRALNTISRNATRRQYEQAAVGAGDNRSEPGWAEIVPIVDEALDKLREPIILHYFQGLTQAEVAASLGINQSTVSRHLERAVDSLRKELKKSGVVLTVGALAALLIDNTAASVPVPAVAALGKIAVSGIGTGVSAGTATGVSGGSIAASKALLSTSLGKAAILLGVLAVSLSVGQRICANRVSDPASDKLASTSGEVARRDPSALQFYLLQNTVSTKNPKGTWRVSTPKQADEGYIFERLDQSGNVVEALNSANQPNDILSRIAQTGQYSPILSTNDLLPNAEARAGKDGKPVLNMEFNEHGTKVFADFTGKHVNEHLGVFANGRLISAPVIFQALTTSHIQVRGFASLAQAEALARQINGGKAVQP